MQKSILILVLIAIVIVAGCLGTKEIPPAAQPPAQNIAAPTGDAAAIGTGAGDVENGITDAEATQSELNPDINDSDLNLGI